MERWAFVPEKEANLKEKPILIDLKTEIALPKIYE